MKMHPFVKAQLETNPAKLDEIIVDVQKAFPQYSRERIEAEWEKGKDAECFMNNLYQVRRFPPNGGIIWLSIKRLDKKPIHDWRDLYRIKNMLVGPENEAVEIYPAESDLVDAANQYHLWVFEDPKYRLPFGFHQGRLVTSSQGRHDKQRAGAGE